MKKEDLIALGIDEDVAKQVMALHGKTVTTLSSQVSTLTAERDSLQEQATANQAELDTLKESAKGNEELTKQLADLQAKFDESKAESETKLTAQQKDFAIQLALKEANTLDDSIVLDLLDKETIKVTEGGLQGFKEQLDSLKESKAFLFKQEEAPATQPTFVVGQNATGGSKESGTNPFEAAANKF